MASMVATAATVAMTVTAKEWSAALTSSCATCISILQMVRSTGISLTSKIPSASRGTKAALAIPNGRRSARASAIRTAKRNRSDALTPSMSNALRVRSSARTRLAHTAGTQCGEAARCPAQATRRSAPAWSTLSPAKSTIRLRRDSSALLQTLVAPVIHSGRRSAATPGVSAGACRATRPVLSTAPTMRRSVSSRPMEPTDSRIGSCRTTRHACRRISRALVTPPSKIAAKMSLTPTAKRRYGADAQCTALRIRSRAG
mmetsp:Transcript_73253/g.174521  ORF Transcript_73253/g.174521 Transcript_73253/m.174521 type:complete len:258 (-) Transcript_73253:2607-3380(-)